MNLCDNKINEYISKVRQFRIIKAVKLQKNNLTDEGFDLLCESLKNVYNINLSYNNLTSKIFDIILKKKHCFFKLRIINLSNNKVKSRL